MGGGNLGGGNLSLYATSAKNMHLLRHRNARKSGPVSRLTPTAAGAFETGVVLIGVLQTDRHVDRRKRGLTYNSTTRPMGGGNLSLYATSAKKTHLCDTQLHARTQKRPGEPAHLALRGWCTVAGECTSHPHIWIMD